MSRRIVALPTSGIPGTGEEANGIIETGVYKLVATVFEPGEEIPESVQKIARKKTLAEWKTKYWKAASQSLVIPFANTEFTIGPEQLGQTGDAALVVLRTEFWYKTADPKP